MINSYPASFSVLFEKLSVVGLFLREFLAASQYLHALCNCPTSVSTSRSCTGNTTETLSVVSILNFPLSIAVQKTKRKCNNCEHKE